MGDEFCNSLVNASEETVHMASKSNEERLFLANNMNTVNHSSECECTLPVSLTDTKPDDEKEVRDLVPSTTYSLCVEPAGSSLVVEFPHFPLQRDPSGKIEAFTDKDVLECDFHESDFCYKENICQDVKDICIDEGVPTRNQTLWVDTVDDNKIFSMLPEMDPTKEVSKDQVISDALVLYALDLASQEDSNKPAAKQHHCESLVQMAATDPVADDAGKEKALTESKTAMRGLNEEDSRFSVDKDDLNESNCSEISGETTIGCTSDESKVTCKETASGDPALPSMDDESKSQSLATDSSKMADERGVAFQFTSSAPSSGRDDNQKESEHIKENCQEDGTERDYRSTANTSELAHHRYDSRDDIGHLQHGFGESSFSAAVTLSSLITHSDAVPYSGSISLRSESSTTSTRSFAFPVLQTEWNSSPVRMAKAERRRFGKCRGWREGLFCCRF